MSYVFMDESGDAGMKLSSGSSRYFCMTAVIFEDELSANACDRSMDQLRRTLKFPPRHEFHFSESSKKIRSAFFTAILDERFSYHSFIIDKSKLAPPAFKKPTDFYEFAVRIVCDNARDLLNNSRVVIDHSGDKAFRSAPGTNHQTHDPERVRSPAGARSEDGRLTLK